MKQNLHAVAFVLAAVIAMPVTANASEASESSIQYFGDAKPRGHDRKIEEAALRRAAEKIGDLRGSVEGFDDQLLMRARAKKGEESSWLGFPVIEETLPGRRVPADAVPIV